MKYLKTFENKNKKFDKIYINSKLSEYFEAPYKNDNDDFVISVDALEKSNPEWDQTHKDIFQKYRGKDLILRGDGFGWWKIVSAN